MKNSLLFFILLAIAMACDSDPDESINTEQVFIDFHNDLESHYAGFTDKNQAQRLYSEYLPLVKANPSEADLWEILKDYSQELNDEHVKLFQDESGLHFISGAEQMRNSARLFNLGNIAQNYLDNIGAEGDFLLFGDLSSEVGYLYVAALLEPDPNFLNRALENLNLESKQALIIDLRQCIGGYDGLSRDFAAHFSQHQNLVFHSKVKTGKDFNDYHQPREHYSPELRTPTFQKPIILLTDRGTVSEAEILSLYLRSNPQTHHFGDTTAGALSLVSNARFLQNGWRYEYSIQKIINPDGSSYEKIGIPPQHYSSNSIANVKSGQDQVLEDALQFLNTNYNIH